ncbi:glycosyltransferase family 2 protein [Sulfuricella sp. T08]|uniref:glycosyltransferase family 2 protein n=1 Tax=Sulfuricella sp. T08 TaxID=1632857 RepID=UPI000A694E39|nr:glycosyltransferase family 2 protein [Sulfuricella sp. T08]
MGSVWIIIVNYRTSELTIDCLRALSTQAADLAGNRLVVVDNASGDDSVEKLTAAIEREGWSSWVDVMPLDRNGGFAFGNNASIRMALASTELLDYVMLLNPDTVTRPGAVKTLVDFMDAHPRVGIAGSQLENADGDVECSAHTFPSPLSELDAGARLGVLSRLLRRYVVSSPPQSVAHSCDWVSGASMIIRRQVIEDIGLMDENYFLYFEEVDFCHRTQQAGWGCWYVPDSLVMHLEGASTGIRAAAKRRAKYWYDSRRRFFVKHYGITGLVAADVLWAIGRFSFLLRRGLHIGARSNKNNDPRWFMFDLLWGDLWAIMTGRAFIPRVGKQS